MCSLDITLLQNTICRKAHVVTDAHNGQTVQTTHPHMKHWEPLNASRQGLRGSSHPTVTHVHPGSCKEPSLGRSQSALFWFHLLLLLLVLLEISLHGGCIFWVCIAEAEEEEEEALLKLETFLQTDVCAAIKAKCLRSRLKEPIYRTGLSTVFYFLLRQRVWSSWQTRWIFYVSFHCHCGDSQSSQFPG